MSGLLAVALGTVSGVVLRSLFVFGWSVYAFVFLLACIFIIVYASVPRRVHRLAALFLFCALVGMICAALADTPPPSALLPLLHARASFTGVVTGDPDVRDSTQRTAVRVSYAGTYATLLVVSPRNPALAVGERVTMRGTLDLPQPFASEGGRVFRYDKYLQREGIRFILDYASVAVQTQAPWYSLPALLARAKHTFLSGLDAALPEPYASLAGGIVIGGKSGLGNKLQDAFTRTGLIQIIVLSGYNVMVVAEWVMAALAYTRVSLRVRASWPASLSTRVQQGRACRESCTTFYCGAHAGMEPTARHV